MIAEFLFLAHSWYPQECCNGQDDCHVVELVKSDKEGFTVKDGMMEVIVPKTFPHRNSEDGDYHLCYDQAAWRIYHDFRPFCFFIPGMS